jgi:hypothetical protein
MTRSVEQNEKMWAMLTDISAQIPWLVNGQMTMLSKEDWKDILSASLFKGLRLAYSTDGDAFVLLGRRTKDFSIADMSQFIEFIYAFGADRGVKWSEVYEH